MKKLLLSLLACGTIAAANAQAGSTLVYGQIGINSSEASDNSKSMNWWVTPGIGYQFDNHWTGGIFVDYRNGGSKAAVTGAKWNRSNEYQVGLFGRYTQNLNKIFSVFGQLNAGYIHGNLTSDGKVINDTRYNGFAVEFTPAIMVNVHNGLALNFSIGGLGYRTTTTERADNSDNNFSASFGQQFSWGISKNFGGHNRRIHREPGTNRHMKNWRDDDGDGPRKAKKAKRSDDDDE